MTMQVAVLTLKVAVAGGVIVIVEFDVRDNAKPQTDVKLLVT